MRDAEMMAEIEDFLEGFNRRLIEAYGSTASGSLHGRPRMGGQATAGLMRSGCDDRVYRPLVHLIPRLGPFSDLGQSPHKRRRTSRFRTEQTTTTQKTGADVHPNATEISQTICSPHLPI
jgi:hypothetical protein